MIKKASECSIRQFMHGLYEDDVSEFENIELIWTEYIDLSGISENMEKDLLVSIHNIDVRRMVVPEMVKFQRDCVAALGVPYVAGFWFFKKYGHRLEYDGDNQAFDHKLEMILADEKVFYAEQEILKKDLEALRKDGVKMDDNGRKEFIRLLNAVGRSYSGGIDRDKTDVESYALMVREYIENQKQE